MIPLPIVSAVLLLLVTQPSLGPPSIVYAERVVDSYKDLQGTLYSKSPSEKVQIIDFQFGLTEDLVLCPAYLNSIGFDGVPYVLDQRNLCSKIFTSISEVRGFYLMFGKTLGWVEDVTFAIGEDGVFYPAAYSAIEASNGRASSRTIAEAFAYQITTKCKWMSNNVCGGPGSCTGTCPGIQPAPCPCSGGTGTCQVVHTVWCPVNGPCPPGEHCAEVGINCRCES